MRLSLLFISIFIIAFTFIQGQYSWILEKRYDRNFQVITREEWSKLWQELMLMNSELAEGQATW